MPDGFTIHPKLVRQLEQRREVFSRTRRATAMARRRDPVGARRGARVRLAADRGDPDPPDRPGHRARHVQPAPPRPARPQDRPGALPDPAPAGRAGPDGAAQQPAVGDGLPRVRVRLLAGGARDARAVGGPVRRLRQRRPGDHRPVHRLGPGEVGPDLAADAAAAARLRGLGARALLGPARAVPPARRRGQHPRGQPDHAGPVLPPAAPAGAGGQAAPAGGHDPQEPAAPAPGHEHVAGAGRGPLPAGAARARRAGRDRRSGG